METVQRGIQFRHMKSTLQEVLQKVEELEQNVQTLIENTGDKKAKELEGFLAEQRIPLCVWIL